MIHKGYPILAREEMAPVAAEGEATPDQVLGILRRFLTGTMHAYPVDRLIGDVRNNVPALLDEIAVAA
jgi:hypothetical protein